MEAIRFAISETDGLAVVVLPILGAMFLYGLMEILYPKIPIMWQVRATSKARGFKRATGEAVGVWVGSIGKEEPWRDKHVRRRVRLVGLLLIAIAVGIGFPLAERLWM